MKISRIMGQTLVLGFIILAGRVICQGEATEAAASEQKAFQCNNEVLRSYMLKGRLHSTPDPMILCPDIKTNCCTKIDIQHIYHAVKDILPVRFVEYQSKIKMVFARMRKLQSHILAARPVINGNSKRRLFCNRQAKKVYDFPFEDLYRKLTEELELVGDDNLEHYQKFFCVLCDGENHSFMDLTTKTPYLKMDLDYCEEFVTKRKELLRILNVELVRYLVALQHMVDCTHYVTSYNLDFFNQAKLLLAVQMNDCLEFLGTRKFLNKCEKVCEKIHFSKITQMIDGDYEFLNESVSLFEKYFDYKETGNFISSKLRAFFKGMTLPRKLDRQNNALAMQGSEVKAVSDDGNTLEKPAQQKADQKGDKAKRELKGKTGQALTEKASKSSPESKVEIKDNKSPEKKHLKSKRKKAKRKLAKKQKAKSASKTHRKKQVLKTKRAKKSSKMKQSSSKRMANKSRKLVIKADQQALPQIELAPRAKLDQSFDAKTEVLEVKSSTANAQSDSLSDPHIHPNKERVLQSIALPRELPSTPAPPPQKPPSTKKPKVTAKLQFDPELVKFYEEIMVTTQDKKPTDAQNVFRIQSHPIDFDLITKKFEKENGINPDKYARLKFDLPKELFYKELFTYRDSDVTDPNLLYFLVDFTADFVMHLKMDLKANFKILPRHFELTPPKKQVSQRILLDEWVGPINYGALVDDAAADSHKEVL